MDDGRVGIERLTEREGDDAVVEADGAALEVEVVEVVEDLHDGLALPADEGVVRLILDAQLVPVVELDLAGRDDVLGDGMYSAWGYILRKALRWFFLEWSLRPERLMSFSAS